MNWNEIPLDMSITGFVNHPFSLSLSLSLSLSPEFTCNCSKTCRRLFPPKYNEKLLRGAHLSFGLEHQQSAPEESSYRRGWTHCTQQFDPIDDYSAICKNGKAMRRGSTWCGFRWIVFLWCWLVVIINLYPLPLEILDIHILHYKLSFNIWGSISVGCTVNFGNRSSRSSS